MANFAQHSARVGRVQQQMCLFVMDVLSFRATDINFLAKERVISSLALLHVLVTLVKSSIIRHIFPSLLTAQVLFAILH